MQRIGTKKNRYQYHSLEVYINYARLRSYDVKGLLRHELVCTSLFLTQIGYLRKPVKSELSHEIEQELNQPSPSEVPFIGNTVPTAIVIDFMAYASKVPGKN